MAGKEMKNRGGKCLKEEHTVTEALKTLYRQKLLPLEKYYGFSDFHSSSLEDADFDNKPMILVVGQCSTGKTTFIRYLLEQEYPGSRVGPEPTTNSFTAIMHGEIEGIIHGSALTVDPNKPFRKLSPFGTTFLNRFQCVHLPNRVLESISIIDTPGILSVAKRKMSRELPDTRPRESLASPHFAYLVLRNAYCWRLSSCDKQEKKEQDLLWYDFPAVIRWFAKHVDRIILLCDAHKLEISDEFSHTIMALRGNEDKLRVVLNKADMVDSQELMRVYGALMWSLGKVFCTPEVLRVYIGSFWSSPMRMTDNRKLFEQEEEDLFADIRNLPRNSALRKLNDLVKRARLVRAHAYIIGSLKEEMPFVFCRGKKKRDLIYDLPIIYSRIQQRHQIPRGDFPDCVKMQEQLMSHDFKFKGLKPKLLGGLDELLNNDIAKLMPLLRQEEEKAADQLLVHGGPFIGSHMGPFIVGNPFHRSGSHGEKDLVSDEQWVVSKDKQEYDEIFYNLSPHEGKLSGTKVKNWMMSTHLPSSVLGRIWKLADVDCDGMLDDEEFALAGHLIEVKLEGFGLPHELPAHLVPPSKRPRKISAPENRDNE